MTTKLGQNIRKLRHERKLTQEQLAEAMNVTAGAVYKWESGLSNPDINIIVELACFFDVSVDVLLGYEMKNHSLSSCLERIGAFNLEKRFDEAIKEAESALLRYPNSFELAHTAAMTCYLAMTDSSCPRAIELFKRALELIDQNTNENISEMSIHSRMAEVYTLLKQYDEALVLLKKHNFDGHNEAMIGNILATCKHDPNEALAHLTGALFNNVSSLFRICEGYALAYIDKKEYRNAIDICMWLIDTLDRLREPGRITYFDKICTAFYAACAKCALLDGDEPAARAYLRQAHQLAERYDREPFYDLRNVKFYAGSDAGYCIDILGDTAADAVMYALKMLPDEKSSADEKISLMWEEICNEK